MFPQLLPPLSQVHATDLSQNEKLQSSAIPYFLTAEKVKFITTRLGIYMSEKKPFLRTGYSIRDLGEELGIPSYQLSAYINQWIGMNFNEYFNWFRVKHCQELMENGDTLQLNLRGLAFRCGFNNRNTLTTAFKKFTGLTPSDYFKKSA